MTWINPGNHNEEECYFCVNYVSGTNSPKKGAIQYVATINNVFPVPHQKQSPPLCLPQQAAIASDEEALSVDIELDSDIGQQSISSKYVPSAQINSNLILVTQQYLYHMIRILELSQRKLATLASLLRNNNLLDNAVTVVPQRNRQAEFVPFFETENDRSFCSNIPGLMEALHIVEIRFESSIIAQRFLYSSSNCLHMTQISVIYFLLHACLFYTFEIHYY